MSVSASEIEKLEKSKRKFVRTRYTEEYRLEAVEHYRKAKEIDPKKTIACCARELEVNDKTLNDWILKYEDTGRVTRQTKNRRGNRLRSLCGDKTIPRCQWGTTIRHPLG